MERKFRRRGPFVPTDSGCTSGNGGRQKQSIKKGILYQKGNSIGRKFCKTGKNEFFEKKYFFEDEEKWVFLSGRDETDFAVSFDGSFSRGFEGTEFIESLPIINGTDEVELKGYLPKRGEDEVRLMVTERLNIGGGIALQRVLGLSDYEGDESSSEEQGPPSEMRKVAWAWERRVLRASSKRRCCSSA